MKSDTLSASGQIAQQRGGQSLGRYANVTGAATLASRVLGLARD